MSEPFAGDGRFATSEWCFVLPAAVSPGFREGLASLGFDGVEAQYPLEPNSEEVRDSLFARRWARVLTRPREEPRAAGDGYRFERLVPFLTGRNPGECYKRVGVECEITEAAVKVAVHRLRGRYGQLMKAEVVRRLNDPEEVDAGITHPCSALTG